MHNVLSGSVLPAALGFHWEGEGRGLSPWRDPASWKRRSPLRCTNGYQCRRTTGGNSQDEEETNEHASCTSCDKYYQWGKKEVS